LEGEIGDEAHKMKGGDFQIMTAGSGIVHTETIDKIAKMRLLQLWVNLSKKENLKFNEILPSICSTLNPKGIF